MINETTYSVITATGSYIPPREISNEDFLRHEFLDSDGGKFEKSNEEIIGKLEEITGITERRYVSDDQVVSDIAFLAAQDALESSGADKESFDYIIVAHNFGDVRADNRRSDIVPTVASRVKHRLRIANPRTVAYDITFGCPGWLQAVIQANYFLKSGDAKKALIIGAETLSRVSDPHDRDSMIYADGAGAVILEARNSGPPIGILSHAVRSDTLEHAFMLRMDKTYNHKCQDSDLYLKMDGHRLYQYAISTVPLVVKESLDKIGMTLDQVGKVLIHQANAKMDEAILKRIYGKYSAANAPLHVMPMIISRLGNSSVATLPTLLDMMAKGKLKDHQLQSGEIVIMASVGAGMNINSIVYRVP
ncbi:MAG: 3-oxoacyl-ACP synthase [candidate division Zixibacteria bacterium RBG_16_53_22]|nr:MAG: 3-oxoacyl-ACP synthase [candidate division Zixibacteria bacterium RBG_16_53_22]